ncbi:MAG: glycosyl transferase, partial [Oscillospiraceae bacterium]|nr:glycosyl transferase [Oscillospiraceae bacterium]
MRVLMINVPYSGHVNPTIPLTKALVKAGHQVSYINAEPFRKKIEMTGAVFIPYINYPDQISEKEKKRICFQAAYDTAMCLDQTFDVLIYEMFFYPGIEIARKKKIPCVRQFSQPAWSEDTWKNTSVLFQLSSKLLDMQVMGKKRIADMNLQYHSMADAIIHDRPDLNLVYVPEKFQRNRDSFDASFMFAVPAQEQEKSNIVIPYDKMKHPVIYISLGSMISSRVFYRKCIKAFKGKNFSVILNTGRIAPASLGKIPDNIYAYSFVPQIEVLKHADVFLTHCGMNSINEALCAGGPMVAMPVLNDQPENAKQIVNLGLGKSISPFSNSKALYHAVCEVYENKAIKN